MKSGWLLKILRNPEVQQLIDDDDFASLYGKLDRYMDGAPLREVLSVPSLLTDLFLQSGIDPLAHMDYIPAGYRREAPIHSFDIPNHIKRIGDDVFRNCKLLDSIDIPGNVEVIGDNAFDGCSSLRSVTFDPGLKVISRNAFRRCTTLKSVDLPSTLERLEDFAFAGTRLKTLKLPKSLQYIGNTLFAGGEAPDMYYEGTAEELRQLIRDSSTFPVLPGIDGHFKIVCSDRVLTDAIGN